MVYCSLFLSIIVPQMRTNPSDDAQSLIVLTPVPRVHHYSAAAVPPDKVEEVMILKHKEEATKQSTIVVNFTVTWSPVKENTHYYKLEVLTENRTESNSQIHTIETVRELCIAMSTLQF